MTPEQNRAKVAAWKRANPERARESTRRYRERTPDRRREQGKKWRQANADKVRRDRQIYTAANKEKIAERNRRYRQENKGKVLADRALRKARKRNATPPWLTVEQKAQMREAYDIAVLASAVLGEPYHVDHIMPLSGGNCCGLHVPWNLRVIRAADNLRKGNRIP
jgi:hypothetical protein